MKNLALTLSLLIFSFGCGKDEPQQTQPAAPIEIPVVQVSKKDLPIISEFVGQTRGAVDAEVRARVDGVITGVHFEEGKPVTKDQLLYTIDPAPFQAKVAQARAKLAEAETALVKSQSDLKRVKPLAEMKALSQRDLDAAVAQEGVSRGSVDAAKANVESAEIELSYTKITSPATGVIGLSNAKVGEYVGRVPNPVVLATISVLDPIHVRFSVSEQDFLFFSRKRVEDGGQAQKSPLELVLADGSTHNHKGELVSVDNQIDPKTGSFTAEAAFPNPDKILRPGLFARIRAVGRTLKEALVIPSKAIKELQGQYSVFVISSDGSVTPRTIKLGPLVGQDQVVTEGLSEGDTVAVDGIQRLRQGMKVSAKLSNPA